MYNNYMSPQERIDMQIKELEKMRQNIPQMQQPTNLTQNFSMMPQAPIIKYANSLDDVKREMVMGETPYFSKDMSVVWIKNVKGDIKTYELNEIVPKDNKDLQIEYLQAQIEELRKEMKNYERTNDIDEPIAKSIEDEEPTSITTITKSKKSTRNDK